MKTALAAALLLLALAPPIAARAQGTPEGEGPGRPTTLDLSASGEVKTAPDMASIVLGFSNDGPTAAAAAQTNARQMGQMLAAIKRMGVAERDIQTSGLNLNPDYTYADNQPPKLAGYKAADSVTVTVDDLGKLGPLIDAIAAAGANEIQGVTFGLKDPQGAADEARRRAVKALLDKAQLYAQAAGYRIQRLMVLRETGGEPVNAPAPLFAARAKAQAATPIEAGQLDVRASVSAVFELAK